MKIKMRTKNIGMGWDYHVPAVAVLDWKAMNVKTVRMTMFYVREVNSDEEEATR